MSESSDVKMETENDNKKEGGVIGGSLGVLLNSYGDGAESDSSEEDPDSNKDIKKEEELVPSVVIKTEPFVRNPLHDTKERESGDKLDVANKPTATDFSILSKDSIKVELNLDEKDFFPEAETFGEARPVKVEVESGTSDSESDSENSGNSEHESEDGEGNTGGSDQEKAGNGKRKPDGVKGKGEIGLDDLPPIEDLHISVPHDECKPIGVVKSVVEPLVIVEAYPETPALDLESVLFLEEGDRALGHIFDVIGPVRQPIYCVRFNSKEHIEKNKVEVGMLVYCAPKTPYTSYVFLAQLRRLKGSDASWLNDIEPPVEEVEYSDDEMERMARKKKRNRKLQARVTEEDATNNEEDAQSTHEANFRGRKRQHNHFENHNSLNSAQYGSIPSSTGCPRPPFMPPMVPGFTPFVPAPVYNGYPTPGPWFPGPEHMNRHRGFPRSRGARGAHNRFRPPNFPPQQPYHANAFQQLPNHPTADTPHWRSWNPPMQWQNQNSVNNYNFGGMIHQNPYAHNMYHAQPRTPQVPPPPPPPPGQ